MVEADLQVGVSAPMYVVSAFRRTCRSPVRSLSPAATAGILLRWPLGTPADARRTQVVRVRLQRAGCCCHTNGFPRIRLVAPTLGDRVGRLRKTPAAAPGVYRPENLLRQRTFREADQRFGALSRRICQRS